MFSSSFFFCAVDAFLIQIRCCLYFGGPLAASKTKQNSRILFQQDIEVSSQDKGKSSQYCICKAELIISFLSILGSWDFNVCKMQGIANVARASFRAGTGSLQEDVQHGNSSFGGNSHGDFLNTHTSLTATVPGILVSFSEGWLVSQVVSWYCQPAVPYQPNTPLKRLKPNYHSNY